MIEASGPNAAPHASAVVGDASIAARPIKAQIFGTGTFHRSESPCEEVAAFRAGEERL